MKRPRITSIKDKGFFYLGLGFLVMAVLVWVGALIGGFSPLIAAKPASLGGVICLLHYGAKRWIGN